MMALLVVSLCCVLLFDSGLAALSEVQPSDSAQLVTAVNTFSFDLFLRIANEKWEENEFISPFSVTTVLSMLLAGAEGSTAEQLIKSMHLDVIDANGKDKGLQLISQVSHWMLHHSTNNL